MWSYLTMLATPSNQRNIRLEPGGERRRELDYLCGISGIDGLRLDCV